MTIIESSFKGVQHIMKNVLIVGGTKGIGGALAKSLVAQNHKVVIMSRNAPSSSNENLSHFKLDVTKQDSDLPDLDHLDALVYCPGSINLKPFARITLEEFQSDLKVRRRRRRRIAQNE